MPIVLCPVCRQPLTREPHIWRCPAGHCFDEARQGYVNLLTVTEKHSRNPGDTPEQVTARREFLNAGFYAPVAEAVAGEAAALSPRAVLDAGCGEGYYLGAVQSRLPEADCCGLDISRSAVKAAAAQNKSALWLVGTSAHLPFDDGSFNLVLSMFALTAAEEFARVLAPDGSFLQVLAGQEHLMALKTLIYPEILLREKQPHPELPGFRLEASRELRFSFTLSSARQVGQLLAMTPHFWRITKEGAARAAACERLTDTAVVILNRYRKI